MNQRPMGEMTSWIGLNCDGQRTKKSRPFEWWVVESGEHRSPPVLHWAEVLGVETRESQKS